MNRVQEWCPNCEHFEKISGLNYCKIGKWLDGDQRVLEWLRIHQPDDSTRIDPKADNCPGFVPYASLAQSLYRRFAD